MSEEFASVTFAVLHQLSNSLTAAEGYGSLLGDSVTDRAVRRANRGLQSSLIQAQILLQSLESSRKLLKQGSIRQQTISLEMILTSQLIELQYLLKRHRVRVDLQRVYHAPAVTADVNYTTELIRLILSRFVLRTNVSTDIHVTITAHKDCVRLGFADTKSPTISKPQSAQQAIGLMIIALANRAQVQFVSRSHHHYLIFPRARQLPLISEDSHREVVKSTRHAKKT